MMDEQAYCEKLAGADLLPPCFRGQPANLLLVKQHAAALDIPLIVAIQGMSVTDGRVGMDFWLFLRLCSAGPKLARAAVDFFYVSALQGQDARR